MKLRIPYWPLLMLPYACRIVGAALNVLVLVSNKNTMPVLGPGGCSPAIPDVIHTCMTHASHLKILSDWIFWPQSDGLGFASIGDMFITVYEKAFIPALAAWFALTLRDYND